MARTLYSVAACDDVADKIVNSLTGVGISPTQITLLRRLKAHKDAATPCATFRCVTSDHDSYFCASGLSTVESKPYREALEDGRIVIALSVGGTDPRSSDGAAQQVSKSAYIRLNASKHPDSADVCHQVATQAV